MAYTNYSDHVGFIVNFVSDAIVPNADAPNSVFCLDL